MATVPGTSASVGQTVSVSVTSAGCASPLYQYWVAPPGGAFAVVQPYTSSAGIQWATTGLAPGVYILDVWARDAHSAAPYDTYGYVYFSLTQNCVSLNMATNPAGTAAPGALVSVSVTGVVFCPNPRYAYWVAPPGGAFSLLQTWTAATSITWNTAGLQPGVYVLVIWAKDVTSPSPGYDAYTSLYFTLGARCTAASIGATPGGQITAGTSVALSANASGCPNPQFEFWLGPPGGGWQPLRGYSSSSSAAWNTSGLGAGTYVLDVWARDASSGAAWDIYAYTTVTVATWTPCTGATISVYPGTSVAIGTTLTLTALAVTGCSSPTYAFWVSPPGGSWQPIRGYGAINYSGWSTQGLTPGTYIVDIWVKDANSPAYYDTYTYTYVSLH